MCICVCMQPNITVFVVNVHHVNGCVHIADMRYVVFCTFVTFVIASILLLFFNKGKLHLSSPLRPKPISCTYKEIFNVYNTFLVSFLLSPSLFSFLSSLLPSSTLT